MFLRTFEIVFDDNNYVGFYTRCFIEELFGTAKI